MKAMAEARGLEPETWHPQLCGTNFRCRPLLLSWDKLGSRQRRFTRESRWDGWRRRTRRRTRTRVWQWSGAS